jgi:CSLREA domain-containing protein
MIQTRTKKADRKKAWASGLLVLVLVAACLLLAASPAHAKTFFVNSTSDDGDDTTDGNCGASPFNPLIRCTLRETLQEANATAAADTINFRIAGMNVGVKTISPATPLPIIRRPVTIDGYTQEGASENSLTQPGQTNASPRIELDGTNAGSSPGLEIRASNVVVKGLVINRSSGSGIFLAGGTGHKVEGNFIGTDPSGIVEEGNTHGVLLQNTDGSTIGGTSPEDRNLISGNSLSGVLADSGSSGNKIQGNLIGTNRDGTSNPIKLGNDDYGVAITSSPDSPPTNNNTVGGVDDPSTPLTEFPANTIAFNTDGGVGLGFGSAGNRILSNSIFSNIGLGIDLVVPFGVTPNDHGDPDTGPNRLQNFPLLTSATTSNQVGTTINGTLDSTPSTRRKKRTFIIQFFSNPEADPSGYGEGKTFIGQTRATTNRQGNASFGFAPAQEIPEGQFITATATRSATGDTSEFSEARVVEELGIGG